MKNKNAVALGSIKTAKKSAAARENGKRGGRPVGLVSQLIAAGAEIRIIAGEGERGTTAVYDGTRTARAIKNRLTRERCRGDRWARATIYSHANDHGPVFIDFESDTIPTIG